MRTRKPRRNAHQDVGTDPFESGFDAWEGVDEIAENYSWATCGPGKKPKRAPWSRLRL
jgi:hypothetical protein